MAICYSVSWPFRWRSYFIVFGHTVFANSIRVSFPFAILAMQVGEASPRQQQRQDCNATLLPATTKCH
jgi:hypothetical protein